MEEVMKLTEKETTVLSSLRKNAESNDNGIGSVYLDNVVADLKIDRFTFRSILGSLTKKELYIPYPACGTFGQVVME
jgi:hypothetical protein